ncbi:MAG TPA: hypothetical protein PLT49_12895, partial [Ferruginibacter sp.]|nr:hypothetical protein [Ferruginibacter sp.]
MKQKSILALCLLIWMTSGMLSCKKSSPSENTSTEMQVSGGGSLSLVVRPDRTAWATGSNTYGQLGDGTTTDRNAPVKVLDNVIAVSAGLRHSLFLKADNSLWAAGYNGKGQLGDGTTI